MSNFGYTAPKTRAQKVVWSIVAALILAFCAYVGLRNFF